MQSSYKGKRNKTEYYSLLPEMKRKAATALAKKTPRTKKTKKMNYRATFGSTPLMRGGKELKFLDTDIAGTYTTTGAVVALNLIAQGTDNTNRVGRAINLKSLYITGFVGSDGTAASCYRYLVVYDRSPQGALPAITDFFTTADMRGMVNLNNVERFSILADKRGAVEFSQGRYNQIKEYIKLNLSTLYNGTGAPIANIASGGLYFVRMGNESVIGVFPTSLTLFARLRYTDV